MTRLWRSRVVTLTVILAVFALVAAACSPSEEEAVETSTTTSTTEATTTTTKPPETTTTEPKPQKPYGGEAIVADDEEPPTLNPYAPGGSKTIVSLIGQGYLTGVQDVDGYTLELIPEVVTELPTTANGGDRLIICNGFKEAHYVRHALLATKLGRRVILVIENLTELGSGLPAGLSTSFLRIFEEFSYDAIDVRIQLEGDSAEVGGLARDDVGYYLVRGSGLPRIDVIGRNRRVAWKDLVERLQQIQVDGAKIE